MEPLLPKLVTFDEEPENKSERRCRPFTCKVSTFTSQKKPLGRHQRPTKCPVAQEDLTVRARATDGRNAAAAAHSGQKGRDLRALDAKSSCTSANELQRMRDMWGRGTLRIGMPKTFENVGLVGKRPTLVPIEVTRPTCDLQSEISRRDAIPQVVNIINEVERQGQPAVNASSRRPRAALFDFVEQKQIVSRKTKWLPFIVGKHGASPMRSDAVQDDSHGGLALMETCVPTSVNKHTAASVTSGGGGSLDSGARGKDSRWASLVLPPLLPTDGSVPMKVHKDAKGYRVGGRRYVRRDAANHSTTHSYVPHVPAPTRDATKQPALLRVMPMELTRRTLA